MRFNIFILLTLVRRIFILYLLNLSLRMMEISSSKTHLRQKRNWIIDTFDIEEEYPGSFPYVLGTINIERDYHVKFELHGMGVNKDPKGVLKINKEKGVITVHKKVDYEQYHVLKLAFVAMNPSDVLDTRLAVEINIRDVNDHAPEFQQRVYETSVEESLPQGSHVFTVFAVDKDKSNTPNSTFTYRISSVTPQTPNAEFFIEQNGKISFKGCLDYENAKKYAILVEAKDQGEVVQLSSTCTVVVNILDKNNHMPTFANRTGSSRVNERETGTTVLKLHVADKDSKGTPAWKAVYTIHGDKENFFSIQTDPQTNAGILTIVKPLDFETTAKKNLSVSVENEEPLFFCEVREKTRSGLWHVNMKGGAGGTEALPAPFVEHITVFVDDVNDPPVFIPAKKTIVVEENTPAGRSIYTFTAIDLDSSYANKFEFKKANDSDNWVTLDSKTGQITTLKTMDRESKYVVNSTYTVTAYAVDKGTPPMTGTGTLIILLSDQNDNVPLLLNQMLNMCQLDGPSRTDITAHDADLDPYATPYLFELLGDVKDKWHLDPYYGTTATLVKESTVYSGTHMLQLKISDAQGHFSVQNLSVTVCDCSVTPNCWLRRSTGSRVDSSAMGVIFAALFILLGVVLLAFFVSCAREKVAIPVDPQGEEYLFPSNTETPGTDCEVPNELLHKDQVDKGLQTNSNNMPQVQLSQVANQSRYQVQFGYMQSEQSASKLQHRISLRRNVSMNSQYKSKFSRKVQAIQAREVLPDYEPRPYAYEGDLMTDPQLDSISIPGSEFTPEKLLDLGPKFSKLAAIRRPMQD
ncbi:cadherin-like protein 26 [Scleropages formosus]|uniref:cadherin-like protein 26 n=1 Tax=Scleropages formosus TaxID=113540 RepID=UPI0010FA7AD2|nr:cadherin-like protein 26 [Scleropages formosus]